MLNRQRLRITILQAVRARIVGSIDSLREQPLAGIQGRALVSVRPELVEGHIPPLVVSLSNHERIPLRKTSPYNAGRILCHCVACS